MTAPFKQEDSRRKPKPVAIYYRSTRRSAAAVDKYDSSIPILLALWCEEQGWSCEGYIDFVGTGRLFFDNMLERIRALRYSRVVFFDKAFFPLDAGELITFFKELKRHGVEPIGFMQLFERKGIITPLLSEPIRSTTQLYELLVKKRDDPRYALDVVALREAFYRAEGERGGRLPKARDAMEQVLTQLSPAERSRISPTRLAKLAGTSKPSASNFLRAKRST